jgi:hypothetical protein
LTIFLFETMSPFFRDSNPGRRPGSARTQPSMPDEVSKTTGVLTLHHIGHQFLRIAPYTKELELIFQWATFPVLPSFQDLLLLENE